MKKFRFTLASVQTVRSIRELRAREVFSLAVALRVKAEEALHQSLSDLRNLEQMMLDRRKSVMVVGEQVAFANEHMVRIQGVRDAESALAKAHAHMQDCREKWIESRRDLKLLENLESKARVSHRIACDKEEQAQMDDRSSAMAGRPPLLES